MENTENMELLENGQDEEKMTLEKFEDATEEVKKVTQETKLVFSEYYSSITGNKVYFKPENMQFTGAYKVRGAYYKISTLSEEEKKRGLITASAGNHAQGVAYAAKLAGIRAVIVMPTTTPLIKVNRTRNYGAEVILHGNVFDEACAYAYQLASENGYTFVHPFDDLDVATGQGTIAMEIIQRASHSRLHSGSYWRRRTLHRCFHPCQAPESEDPGYRRRAGRSQLHAGILKSRSCSSAFCVNTIADGTAVKRPGEKLFPYIQQNVDEIITVEDSELIVAFLDMVENRKIIVENSGLLTVAALKHLDVKKKKIVSILSGGNMDVITMSSVVQHGLIQRDRIFTVSVLLPDKPGVLAKVSSLLAEEKGNVIKLEHNQFISINRNAAVELRITLEAEGTEHKNRIVQALNDAGYRPKLVKSKGVYSD